MNKKGYLPFSSKDVLELIKIIIIMIIGFMIISALLQAL